MTALRTANIVLDADECLSLTATRCRLCQRPRPVYSHGLCRSCWKELLND